MANHLNSPATLIVYLKIGAEKDLNDSSSNAGRDWATAIDIVEKQPGFRRAYWGRSPEVTESVQLHIARDKLHQHNDFRYSSPFDSFEQILKSLVVPSSEIHYRHALMAELTLNCKALGRGAPFTGSAVYVATDPTWNEGAWPLWTHIVRHVDGCLGCAGGQVLEPVDGHDNCYIVYVGWETIEKHEAYHHTRHYANRRFVLGLGNKGYREYGHIVFNGSREKSTARL